MANFHTIKAQLYDNALTENPNDFVARTVSERSLTVADVCNSAVSRGGADISAPAMNHAVSNPRTDSRRLPGRGSYAVQQQQQTDETWRGCFTIYFVSALRRVS